MKKRHTLTLLFIVLAMLHQDFWFWDDPHLVLGTLPVGLAYHAMYSVIAGLFWFLVLKFAWPTELDDLGESGRMGRGASE